jgi:hypothetical protein
MYIYTSTQVHPYVYQCVHKDTGKFYFGYREKNKYPSNIDFPKYKSSSKIVNPNFEQYDWYIVAEFFKGDDAYDFEQLLINFFWNDPLLLNENCQFNSKKRFKNNTGLKGNLNPMYGGFSALHRENLSKSKTGKRPANFDAWVTASKGTVWCHNPITKEQKRVLEIPDGFVPGKIKIQCNCGKLVDAANFSRHHSAH